MIGFNGAIFIIARLSSKRVPKKNLIEIDGMPMILRLYRRLQKSNLVNRIIICTSDDTTDDPLVQYCNANNMLVGRGSLSNIMERICEVANHFNVDHIIEILGDNPFVQHQLVDEAVRIFQSGNYDYVANYSNDYNDQLKLNKYPIGTRVQVYSKTSALDYLRKDLTFLSHPTSFLFANPDEYRVKLFGAEGEFNEMSGGDDFNISVNYPQNLKFAEYIFKKFSNDVSIPVILKEIKTHTHLLNLMSQKDV
jgi:spore coat polysaccharide biosynthesis protein SpsF